MAITLQSVNLSKSNIFIKLRKLIIYLFILIPFTSYAQMESDSLFSLISNDSTNTIIEDTTIQQSEIETTIWIL